MADDIQISVDDSQNIINIDVVDNGNSTYTLDVSGDKYYMGMAKDWAVKMDGKVAGEDFSAKYYANEAKKTENFTSSAITQIQSLAEAADLSAQNAQSSAEFIANNSPTATVEQTATGAIVTTTDLTHGTTTATLLNGAKGDKGDKGATGERGPQGIQGEKGNAGNDGYSPTATVTKSGNTATITITDKNGTTTANIFDGVGSITDVQVNGNSVIDNSVAKIIVPTNNNQLTNGANYITSSALSPYVLAANLANVAFTGNYNDLINKPAFPTIDNLANKDLSNLSSNGEARLHALKGYLDEGELLTDSEGLADVKSYAHSTFDRSKFEVVGNPTITEDGVASGVDNSSYLNIPVLDLSSNNFEIKCKFTYNTSSSIQNIFRCATSGYNGSFGFLVAIPTNEKIYFSGGTSEMQGSKTLINGKTYTSKIVISGNSAKLYVDDEEVVTYGWDKQISTAYISIGQGTSVNNLSIDLKQFSITVDGEEVFSGNKTGIDTIKQDDYTIVGTPTISADGILECSNNLIIDNNYLEKSISITPKNEFEIDFEFEKKINANNTSNRHYGMVTFYSGSTAYFACYYTQTSQLVIRQVSKASTDATTFTYTGPVVSNGWHSVKIIYKEGFLKLYLDGSLVINRETALSNISFGNFLQIRANTNNDWLAYCSFNLNSLIIYVDGNLVYQPCLKVPYTQSKTGSKIVDSVYRDRVADMYSQYGYAPYYTLDEDNGNFTLPMGEVYGMIERSNKGISRNVGEVIISVLPLTDAGLHLLDGALIQGSGIYKGFVNYIAKLYAENPTANYWTTEAEWQARVTQYGVCGKFVYDSVNNTVRLPKVTDIFEGTTDVNALGDLVEAGLYGRNVTGQPQVIKMLVYIVIATSTKTDIQVDIDNVATDLNGKADTDLSNVPSSKGILIERYVNGTSWYRVYSDGWCVQGGKTNVLASNITTEISFLKPFANTMYNITACERYDNGTSDQNNENYWVSSVSSTSFVVYNSAPGYKQLYWQAAGYIN